MNATTIRVGGRFISLRVKLLVGFTLLFTIVFALAFLWFFNFATRLAISRIREDLTDTLRAAAEGVDTGDLVGLYDTGELNADGFSNDPRFVRQLDWLDTVHSVEPRAWPYTYVDGTPGDNEVVWIADLYARYDPSKAVKFREVVQSGGTLIRSLEQFTCKDDFTPYSDNWGSWVSCYQPLTDDAGQFVGAIGVDFEANYVDQVQQAIRDRVLIAFAVTYVVLFVLVYLVSRAFSRPILALTTAAGRIGEGQYDQDLTNLTRTRFPDEIDTLTSVFQIMVDKVYQREQTLRKRVEELQIMVDRGKRDEQVSEIVESDFFQELQEKARHMRERIQRAGGSAE
ncbi:MAG: HAMP domain-containing protein [Anaerolineales bacterium]